MKWLKKVKEWFVSLVIGVEPIKDVPEETKETELNKIARERLALSPRDLATHKVEEPVVEVVGIKVHFETKTVSISCDHAFAQKQVWTRVAARRFELQNKMTCVKCEVSTIEAIR